jgi:hypothetical protein
MLVLHRVNVHQMCVEIIRCVQDLLIMWHVVYLRHVLLVIAIKPIPLKLVIVYLFHVMISSRMPTKQISIVCSLLISCLLLKNN